MATEQRREELVWIPNFERGNWVSKTRPDQKIKLAEGETKQLLQLVCRLVSSRERGWQLDRSLTFPNFTRVVCFTTHLLSPEEPEPPKSSAREAAWCKARRFAGLEEQVAQMSQEKWRISCTPGRSHLLWRVASQEWYASRNPAQDSIAKFLSLAFTTNKTENACCLLFRCIRVKHSLTGQEFCIKIHQICRCDEVGDKESAAY